MQEVKSVKEARVEKDVNESICPNASSETISDYMIVEEMDDRA
jgi:hypothetical protein